MTIRKTLDSAGGLAAESLDAGYGRLQILRDIDLTVNVGETVAILGANGAGKTTLVRALTGFADITGGAVKLDDVVLTKMRPHKRVRLGVVQVPEGRRLFPSLTVEGNLEVAFYSRRRSLSNQRRGELMESAYGLFPRLYERRARTVSRWSCTWTLRRSSSRRKKAIPCSRVSDAFPRERLGVSLVMRAEWS